MALINTLRNKMGKVLVGVIGFSIVAFVAGDLLGPNSVLLGGANTDIAEIGGQTIKYEEFLAKEDELTFNFRQNNQGRSPNSSQQTYLRNQTWEALVAEKGFESQFDILGVQVTQEELEDMVQGDNIHPQIRQAFTNPETGEFNKEQVIEYLSSLADMTPAQRAAYENFERQLIPMRQRSKFDNLLVKTNYVTEEEAKNEYQVSSATAEVNYMYVPFFSVHDSVVSVTDEELEAYLAENSSEYQKDESREIKYITFDVAPSADDTASVLQDILVIKDEFAVTDNDSTYAIQNSERDDAFEEYTMETLPTALVQEGEVIAPGAVVGPEIEDGAYVVYKMNGSSTAEEYSARASHILFKWTDESAGAKAAAKKEARGVLSQIKKGADFADMASIHGTDGTKNQGGDLGWFTQGKKMVKEFDDAVFGAKKAGLLPDVVESQFGYHIIDVTESKTNVVYKVAQISLEIYISDDTRNLFYREAETFAMDATTLADFEANATTKGIKITTAKNVDKNASRISGLTEARTIVFWAYNKASLGDVSEVYEIDDKYIIAALSAVQEEGTAKLEIVRNEVEKKVKDQKKADIISEKISSLGDDELANMVISYEGNGAKYYSMPNLKLSSNSLQSVGLAPEAVGVIFSMEDGERTEPFAVNNGVILIEVVSKIEAPEVTDYETYRNQLLQRRQGRIASKIDNAVKELADIKDDRYKFF